MRVTFELVLILSQPEVRTHSLSRGIIIALGKHVDTTNQSVRIHLFSICLPRFTHSFDHRLTVGSAVGLIRDLFAKIKAIDAKHGKFDIVLCTGDFFGPLKDDQSELAADSEIAELLDGRLEGAHNYLLIRTGFIAFLYFVHIAPIDCYVMQGEHPLPKRVVEKFAKTGGELGKNIFLMSALVSCNCTFEIRPVINPRIRQANPVSSPLRVAFG